MEDTKPPLRILVVDDHAVIRQGIRTLLSSRPEWEVCAEASDGLEAIDKAKSLRPDITLMDISMPGMDGIEASRVIIRDLPESKIIIVSQNDPAIVSRQAAEVHARVSAFRRRTLSNAVVKKGRPEAALSSCC